MSRATRYWFVFLCCVLAVPTCVYGFGILQADQPATAVIAGALLGVAHIFLRPILRLVTKPIGCMTLGLFGLAIDVALVYGCAYFLDGFAVTGFVNALLCALLVNFACLVVGGRH